MYQAGASGGGFSGGFAFLEHTQLDAMTWRPLGITIPANTHVKIRVDEVLTLSVRDTYVTWCNANGDPLGDGCAPKAYQDVWTLPFSGVSGYLAAHLGCDNGSGTADAFGVPGVAGGYAETNFHRSSSCTLMYRRNAYHPSGFTNGYQGAPPHKFRVAGQQKLTVRPIELKVRASSARLQPGVPVTFTAMPSDALTPFSHSSAPAKVSIVWAFQPDGASGPPALWQFGGGQLASCTNQTTCAYEPPSAGRVWAYAQPAGIGMQDDSELVWPNGCATGDSILDSPAVQEGLRELWRRSDPENPNMVQRTERGGFIVRDPLTGEYGLEPWPDGENPGCELHLGRINVPPATVAWVHTHPYSTRELQRGCLQGLVGRDSFYERGARERDRETARQLNTASSGLGDRGYVLDKDGYFTFGPRTPLNKMATALRRCGY